MKCSYSPSSFLSSAYDTQALVALTGWTIALFYFISTHFERLIIKTCP